VTTCDDGGCNGASTSDVETNVARVFDKCEDVLADNPKLRACTDRLRRFSARWLEQHDGLSYGFSNSNADYFAAQTAPDVPQGMMSPPMELLAAMPSLTQVEEVARASGLHYVEQASAIGGTRLFVLKPDPSGLYDQWTLMNLRPGVSPAEVSSRVSFLAVQKTDAQGTPLAAVRVHFRDYLVTKTSPDAVSLTSDASDNAKCYSCHASGVRQLIAMRTPSLDARAVLGEPGYSDGATVPKDFATQRLRAMNERLRSYGLNDWNGQIVTADFGPPLGEGQGCTACHDGKQRGALTVATSQKQLRQKVEIELTMPPASGLSELVERSQTHDPPLWADELATLDAAKGAHKALLAQMIAASAPALEDWILQTPCE
jgi:hypothetical protein